MKSTALHESAHTDSTLEGRGRFGAYLSAALCLVILAFAGVGEVAAQEDEAEESVGEESSEDLSSAEREAAEKLGAAREAYHAGKWYEARRGYEQAYEAAPSDSHLRVEAALGRSTLLWEQGSYDAAESFIDEALELAREWERNRAIGRLLLTLGHTEASQGRLGDAEQTLRHCVRLAAEQKDAVFGPLCKLNHRLVRKLQGESLGDEASYRKALERLESTSSPLTVGLSLSKTAELYARGGQRDVAFELLDQAGAQYDQAGSVPAQARNRMAKARLLQESGRWDAAREKLDGLEETFRGMGAKPALVDVLGLLGDDARHRGAHEKARSYYRRARKQARATESPQLVAKVQVALCDLGAAMGSLEAAQSHCTAAIERFEAVGMPQLEAKARAALGRAAQEAGELERAREALLAALELNEERVHPEIREESVRVNNHANLCQVEMRMQLDGGLYRCRKALEIVQGAGAGDGMVAATHYALGHAAVNEEHPDEGLEHLEKAAEIYAQMESPDLRSYAEAKLEVGAIHKQSDRPKEALEAFEEGVGKLGEAGEGKLLTLKIEFRSQYAQLLLDREKWEQAADQLESSVEEARRAGDTASQAWALSALARAQNGLGKNEQARASLEESLPLAEEAGDDQLVETVESNLETLGE